MQRRYLLLCRGPNCKIQGSNDVRDAVRATIARRGSTDADGHAVGVLPYTCLGRCGRGPNAVIIPDGVWFEALRPDDADEVAACFLGGPTPTHLVADVDNRHAEEYYRLFDELIPEIEAEEDVRDAPRKKRFLLF